MSSYTLPRFPARLPDPRDGQRIAEGPDAARAANALREEVSRRDRWPFPTVYAPPDAIRRNPEGSIVLPAQGAAFQDTVLEFTVDSGFMYVLQAVLITVVPESIITSGNPGPGCVTFSIDRNTPLGGGALQGGPLADWSAIHFPYGSLEHGWINLARAEVFSPEDVVRVKVINNTASAGAPNFAIARFDGYQIPALGRE